MRTWSSGTLAMCRRHQPIRKCSPSVMPVANVYAVTISLFEA